MTDDQDKPRVRSAPRDRKPFAKGGPSQEGRSATKAPRAPRPREPEEAGGGERIAKRLARAGIASRREAEALITDGRVRVNGQVLASPAFNVEPGDRIELDGREIPAPERTRLFLFHKPAGVVTTNRDPEGRRTVFDTLPEGLPRLMTVGRLDINTEGLLLLTNDGGLARVLELPSTGWLRRYRVRVHGEVDEARLKELAQGIAVDGVFYGAIEAELERTQGSNAWLSVGLREGKNREVKNVMGALGLDVNRLIRVSYGPFQLGELEEGQVQELKGRMLRDQLGERLIEEAGADFEAEVRKPFTNRPTARGQEPAPAPAPRQREEPGEGGLIRNRKREREQAREDALGRLSTRPERRFGKDRPTGFKSAGAKDKPFGARDKSFGGKARGGRDEAPPAPERQRSSNVWMAPGARPQGAAKPARPQAAQARSEGGYRREAGENRGGERPFRAGTEAGAEARGGEGEAVRRSGPRRQEGGERSFKPRHAEGAERFGDKSRPARRDAAEGAAPPRADRGSAPRGGFERRGEERRNDREGAPRQFRPRREEGERPREGERPPRRFGERPQDGERAQRRFEPRRREGAGEGTGDRPFAKGPRREGGAFGKGPREEGAGRPSGTGPRRDGPRSFEKKSFGGKPSGGKSFGGKPFAGKTGGPKPGGSRPSGGKPGGRPAGRGPSKPRGE